MDVDDILMEWIENDIGNSPISKKEPMSDSVELLKEVPLPNMSSVTKAMTAVDSEKMHKYAENMRRLIITARRQIGALEEQNQKLLRLAESDCIVRCPACDHCHKKKPNRFLPAFIKAYPARFALELTFQSKEDLFWFMEASQLEADKNGIPVLAPAVKVPPKSLAEAGSRLSKLVEETKKVVREAEPIPRRSPRKKRPVRDLECRPSSSRSSVQTGRGMSRKPEEERHSRRARSIVKTRAESDSRRTRKRRKEDEELFEDSKNRKRDASRRDGKIPSSPRADPPQKRRLESRLDEKLDRTSRDRGRSEEWWSLETGIRDRTRSEPERGLKETERKHLQKEETFERLSKSTVISASNAPDPVLEVLNDDEYALANGDEVKESTAQTLSVEKPAVEEDLSQFGEIVNDDEDVFGELCESDTDNIFD